MATQPRQLRCPEAGYSRSARIDLRPTNRGGCHAKVEPRPGSPSTAECAAVFGQLELLTGKSWIILKK